MAAEELGKANGSSAQASNRGNANASAGCDVVHDGLEDGASTTDEGTGNLGREIIG